MWFIIWSNFSLTKDWYYGNKTVGSNVCYYHIVFLCSSALDVTNCKKKTLNRISASYHKSSRVPVAKPIWDINLSRDPLRPSTTVFTAIGHLLLFLLLVRRLSVLFIYIIFGRNKGIRIRKSLRIRFTCTHKYRRKCIYFAGDPAVASPTMEAEC